MAHSAEIANIFILKAKDDGKPMTQMHLQKLVYISHGWNLAIYGRPLTTDRIEAWQYGPVYPDLREALSRYGRDNVRSEIKNADYGAGVFYDNYNEPCRAELPEEEAVLIDEIYRLYSDFEAFQLSDLTHKSGTPWHDTYVEGGIRNGAIGDNAIRKHFIGLGKSRKTQATHA